MEKKENLEIQQKESQQFYEILKQNQGLLTINLKIPIHDSHLLSLLYTPGVGQSCLEIQKNEENSYVYCNIGNSIALVTDCSGYSQVDQKNWISDAAIPHLEAKCLFYKVQSNLDVFPYILDKNFCFTEQDYVDCFNGLAGSVCGIQLFKISLETEKKILLFLEQNKEIRQNMKYFLITQQSKNYLQQKLQAWMDYIDIQFFVSVIQKALTDCLFRGVLSEEIIDQALKKKENFIKNHSQNTFKLEVSQMMHESILDYIFENRMQKTKVQKNQLINQYKYQLLIGKKSHLLQTTSFEFNEMFNYDNSKLKENSLMIHKKFQGIIEIGQKQFFNQKFLISNLLNERILDFQTEKIISNPELVYEITSKQHWAAIITNGTAILGFGDIGAVPGLPVMEGKSCIFKQLGQVDVVPICIQEKNPDKFIKIVRSLAPIFSAINLEDIKAPECFYIEENLNKYLNYPVFHDDQHGTAIVVSAAVINALKATDKNVAQCKVVINGGGAAGLSITQILLAMGIQDIIVCDTSGAIYQGRKNNMNRQKQEISLLTNKQKLQGNLKEVLKLSDVFIGVSSAGALKKEWIQTMNKKPIILALANPEPEIRPDEAVQGGAFIVATGRSDFKNQVNNSLVFPGMFRGILNVQATKISLEMKLAASVAISSLITNEQLSQKIIIPSSLDNRVAFKVSKAVSLKAIEQKLAKRILSDQELDDLLRSQLFQEQIHSKISISPKL